VENTIICVPLEIERRSVQSFGGAENPFIHNVRK